MTSYNWTVQDFSDACFRQLAQPLSTIDAINYGTGSTLVRWLTSSSSFSIALLIFQATFYALSAAVSAFLFVKWRQADADAKSRIWRRYGLFTALMCVGSCGGVLAASASAQERYYFVRINHGADTCGSNIQCRVDSFADSAQDAAQTAYWSSVGQVPLAIEFLCLCFVKLLVRLMPFCVIASSHSRPCSCLNEW
jgi:hypothetical protein